LAVPLIDMTEMLFHFFPKYFEMTARKVFQCR
jgi:hypothetical protein